MEIVLLFFVSVRTVALGPALGGSPGLSLMGPVNERGNHHMYVGHQLNFSILS